MLPWKRGGEGGTGCPGSETLGRVFGEPVPELEVMGEHVRTMCGQRQR